MSLMINPDVPKIDIESPLRRWPHNPILTSRDVPYRSTLVYNPGVAKWRGRYVMLFRNDVGRWGDPEFEYTDTGIAWSDDGVRWEVEPQPCITVGHAQRLLASFFPNGGPEETIAIYDPRITVAEDGRAYVAFGMSSRHGRRGGLLVTDDFERFEAVCLVAPDNRDIVLFPQKVGGRWVRLERPMNDTGKEESHPGLYGIYVSASPDLVHWDSPRRIISSDDLPFANERVGAGPPPIRTDEGWLVIYHSVHNDPTRGKNGWEKTWQQRYDMAVMLLDLEEPWRVRALAKVPLLEPVALYENYDGKTFETSGYRGGVAFPTAAVVEGDGEVKVYYGAADSFVALATAKLDDLVRFCLDASR